MGVLESAEDFAAALFEGATWTAGLARSIFQSNDGFFLLVGSVGDSYSA